MGGGVDSISPGHSIVPGMKSVLSKHCVDRKEGEAGIMAHVSCL